MSLKDDMQRARSLIQVKRYEEARAILENVEHPTAKEWLQKLDTIAPATKAPASSNVADVKAQMREAQGHIKAQRYEEARAILENVEHPTAKEWLKKLDNLAPVTSIGEIAQRPKADAAPEKGTSDTDDSDTPDADEEEPSSGRRLRIILIALLALIGIGALAVSLLSGGKTGTTPPANATNAAADIEATAEVTDVVASGAEDETTPTQETTEDASAEDPTPEDAAVVVTIAPTEESTAPPPTQESADDNTDPIAPTDDNNAAQVAPVAGDGLRIAFVNGQALFRVDLPEGWYCDCGTSSGTLKMIEDASARIEFDLVTRGFDPAAYAGVPLPDVLTQELDPEKETLVSQDTLQASGREVLFAVIADVDDPEDEDKRYYINDSNGRVVQLTIPHYVDNADDLADKALLIAGTVETETDEAALVFSQQLSETSVAYNAALNRWRLNDFIADEREHTVELPEGWVLESNILGIAMAIREGDADNSRTAITAIPSFASNDELSLADVADLYRDESEEVVSSGQETVNGRDVYFITTLDPEVDFESTSYFVRDSDGDPMALIIQPDVPDKDSLSDALLFMAGNIESEEVAYLDRLARAGLVEGLPLVDDGYVPLQPGQ